MPNDIRPTAAASCLINAHETRPPVGSRVLVLTHGGHLTTTVWGSNALEQFDAWAPYPQIPADVKAIQEARYHGTKK
jgi:hypothetical protein